MNLEDPYEDAQSTYHLMDPTGPCVRKWGLYVLPLFPDVHVQVGTFDVDFWVEGIEIGNGKLPKSRYGPEGCCEAGEDCGVEGRFQV